MRVLVAGGRYGWWGDTRPDCLDNPDGAQIGGGETAMLSCAFALAAKGHEVVCCFRCVPGDYKGVRFENVARLIELAVGEAWDAIISWDDSEVLKLATRTGLRVLSVQMNHIDHDGLHAADLYVSPSDPHARMLSAACGIAFEKFAIVPNAVDPSWFDVSAQRDPYRVYYASSPDRGLHHLLRAWPQVVREVPKAHLHVYYEINRWLMGAATRAGISGEMYHLSRWTRQLMDSCPPSVTFEGAVAPRRVILDACKSGVMAYACDTVFFTEGYGTSVLQAIVAGACPVITSTDAFGWVYYDAPQGEIAEPPPERVSIQGAWGERNPLIDRVRIEQELAPRIVSAIRAMEKRCADRDPNDAHRELDGWSFSSAARWRALAQDCSWDRVGEKWDGIVRRGSLLAKAA